MTAEMGEESNPVTYITYYYSTETILRISDYRL